MDGASGSFGSRLAGPGLSWCLHTGRRPPARLLLRSLDGCQASWRRAHAAIGPAAKYDWTQEAGASGKRLAASALLVRAYRWRRSRWPAIEFALAAINLQVSSKLSSRSREPTRETQIDSCYSSPGPE